MLGTLTEDFFPSNSIRWLVDKLCQALCRFNDGLANKHEDFPLLTNHEPVYQTAHKPAY